MIDPFGNCFELLNIVPWLKQYGTNPVTGKKMKATDLVKMTWYKNADNKYHCPVRFREFTGIFTLLRFIHALPNTCV